MPYVSEHAESSASALLRVGEVPYLYNRLGCTPESKSQWGWRSGAYSQQFINNAENRYSSSGNVVKRIQLLDDEFELNTRASRLFMVNDRDYSCETLTDGTFTGYAAWRNDPVRTYQGAIVPLGFTSDPLPTRPDEGVLRSRAASLLRSIVPTRAEINLTRALGELREAHMLFRARAYLPRNPKEAGGAYLNYIFGLQPTVSDLQRLSETVYRLDSILRAYVAQERVRMRRSSSIELARDSGYGDLPRLSGLDNYVNLGPMFAEVHYLVPASSGYFNDTVGIDGSWSWTASRTLRSFATFEYFVPKPRGLEGRLSRYRQAAARVMGGGLNATTVYDLTPWTWLTNWFLDVGGLLRYQETVNDTGTVMSTSGYSLVEEIEWTASVRNWVYSPAGATVGLWPTRFQGTRACATSTGRMFRHTRRGGSPYSISPNWDLSQQQQAILSVLGISKGPSIKLR